MPCPTCSHTMQCVATVGYRRVDWCPRCGTLVTKWAAVQTGALQHEETATPKLVERCREFGSDITDDPIHTIWRRLGIAEAINPPESRPE